jgi:bacterioferritin
MGTKSRELVGTDVKKIVILLNKAFADEWLAYYQYWIGAKIAHGPMRQTITDEFEEHAGEELKHAGMLAARIIQLGGMPILEPTQWYKMTNCGYDIPNKPAIKVLLKQNIKSEQCAIEVYDKLAEATKIKDVITYQLVLEILKDEIKHEEDLEAFLKDLS